MNHEKAVLKENIKLHSFEAKHYDVQHAEIFNFIEQKRVHNLLKNLSKQINKKDLVLDVGAGTGNISKQLINWNDNVVAADLSKEMLNEIKNSKINCVVAKADKLPFKDYSVSLLTTYSVLHHLPNPENALTEFCRVAKKKAILYLDHDRFIKNNQPENVLERIANKGILFMNGCLYSLSHPHTFKRFFKYFFIERKNYLNQHRFIDRKLTDGNIIDTESLLKILEKNGFNPELIPYWSLTGKNHYLLAKRGF